MSRLIGTIMGLAAAALIAGSAAAASPKAGKVALMPLSSPLAVLKDARAPIGWIEFCRTYSEDCAVDGNGATAVTLDARTARLLDRVNATVNRAIKPVTDINHWGVVEKWDYAEDGQGDCEDYVLVKRKKLMEAGVPASALLITVVRDKKGDGHAVLTVVTDKGDYVLDNQETDILPWADTGYSFVKRQSQQNPNKWVAIGPQQPAVDTVAK
ncbi:MAG: transglutaminase-like cysteine peptidase [Beijerinckiaceae bacterium]